MKHRKLPREREACWKMGYEDGAVALSKLLDEHPEDWNGPCMCGTCLSYGY